MKARHLRKVRRAGISKRAVRQARLVARAKRLGRPEQSRLPFFAGMFLVALAIGLFLTYSNSPGLTGLFTGQLMTEVNLTQSVSGTTTIPITFSSEPTSFYLTGRVLGAGTAKVWLRAGESEYLILDATVDGSVPGYSAEVLDSAASEGDKIITPALDFASNSLWDRHNNGIEPEGSVIDVTLEETQFSWAHDATKVCTRWSVVASDGMDEQLCSGSSDCCAFLGMTASPGLSWDALSLYNGLYGADEATMLTAQVVYHDVSLNLSDLRTDIVYSEPVSIELRWVAPELVQEFESRCDSACSVDNISLSAELRVETTGDAVLEIDGYSYATDENRPPLWLGPDNITINASSNYSQDIEGWFIDPEDAPLILGVTDTVNIEADIEGSTLVLIPEQGFMGEREIVLTAFDGLRTREEAVPVYVVDTAIVNGTNVTNATYEVIFINRQGVEVARQAASGASDRAQVALSRARPGRAQPGSFGAQNEVIPEVVNKIELIEVQETGEIIGFMDSIIPAAAIEEKIKTDVIALPALSLDRAEIALQRTGPVTAILECPEFNISAGTCPAWRNSQLPFAVNETHVMFNVTHFSGYAGGNITIINVQSYPTVGGYWTVNFTTAGRANLTVTPIAETTFAEYPGDDFLTEDDLQFVSITCNDIAQNVTRIVQNGRLLSVEIANFECNQSGAETSLVLTTGKHDLEFKFGDDTKYAHNDALGTIVTEVIESANDVGYYPSVAVDATGVVHISHRDATNSNLRYCNNSGRVWTCTAVESGGLYSSIALDSNNRPHIAHQGSGALRYCNRTGTSWTCTAVESGANYGISTSIAVDTNNKAHISHYDSSGGFIRYCNITGASWSCTNVESTDTSPNAAGRSALALDSANKAHVVHSNSAQLRYCRNVNGAWSCLQADGGCDCGYDPSIAIGPSGQLHLTHYDSAGSTPQYCTNVTGSWQCSSFGTIDGGLFSSVAVDRSNRAHVTFLDRVTDRQAYCINNSGWTCYALGISSEAGNGNSSGRALAVRAGRLSDSATYSNYAHLVVRNSSDLVYVTIKYDHVENTTITTSVNTSAVVSSSPFFVNATVACPGGPGRDCGYVRATLRQNASGSTPNRPINDTPVTPFYASGGPMGGSEWTLVYDSGAGEDYVYDVALDHIGRIIIVGSQGTNSDHRVMVVNASTGVSIWNYSADVSGGNSDWLESVAVDSENNIVVGGIASIAGSDWYLAKLNSTGSVLWSRTWDISEIGEEDYLYHVAVDSTNHIIAAGNDFNIGRRIMKLDSNGNSIWNLTESGNPFTALAIDSDDNIVVATDTLVRKYTPQGSLLWSQSFGGDATYDVTLDFDGNIIVGGAENGGGDSRLRKFNTSGSIIWSKSVTLDPSFHDRIEAVDTDPAGNIYAAALIPVFAGGVTFNHFYIKYTPNGDQVWNFTYDSGAGTSDGAYAVGLDLLNNGYFAGMQDSGGSINWRVTRFNASASSAYACYLNGTRNCTFQWIVNATGSVGGRQTFDVLVEEWGDMFADNDTQDFVINVGSRLGTPRDAQTSALVVNGSADGTLTFGNGYTQAQNITLQSGTQRRVTFAALFNETTVDLTNLTIESAAGVIAVNASNVSGVRAGHTLYLPVRRQTSVFVCPGAKRASDVVAGCASQINFTYAEAVARTTRSGMTISIENGDWKIDNVTGSGMGDATCTGTNPPVSGAWTIQDTTYCEHGLINLTGNLTISAGANLTFENVTLIWTIPGGTFPMIENNGRFTVNYSNLSARNTSGFSNDSFKFITNTSGVLNLKNSFVIHAGLGPSSIGINIAGNHSLIENTTIRPTNGSNRVGIMISGAHVRILGNDINTSGNSAHGIALSSAVNATIASNVIRTTGIDNNHGIQMTSSHNSTLRNNSVQTHGTGIPSYADAISLFGTSSGNIVEQNRVNTTGVNLNIGVNVGGNRNVIRNNTVLTSGPSGDNYGIDVTAGSSHTVSHNTILTNGSSAYGMRLASVTNNFIHNNTISTRNQGGSLTLFVLQSAANNNTISNNTLTGNNTDGLAGFSISSSHNNTFRDNILKINSTSSGSVVGYSFSAGNDNDVINGSIESSAPSTSSSAVSLASSSGNNITGLSIKAHNGPGVTLSSSDGNILTNMNISNRGDSSEHGIYVDGSSHNYISFMSINTSTVSDSAIYFFGASQNNTVNLSHLRTNSTQAYGVGFFNNGASVPDSNRISDSIIVTARASAVFVQAGSEAATNSLINVTFNQSNVTFSGSPSGNLNVSWYTRVFVNSTNQSSVQNANVTLNSTLGTTWNGLTNSSGFTPFQLTHGYLQNNSGRFSSSNYTLNITHTSFTASNNNVNVTGTMTFNVTLREINALSACGGINSPGTYLLLTDLFADSAPCFDITSSHVEIDCRGHTIGYQFSHGFDITTHNVTIRNCVIRATDPAGDTQIAIYSDAGVHNLTILNNTIQTDGQADNKGIYLISVTNGVAYGNAISANGTERSEGIRFEASSGIISNNSINTTSTTQGTNYGIYAASNPGPITIAYNTVKAGGEANDNYGIIVEGAEGAKVISNTLLPNTQGGGTFFNGNNFTIANNSITVASDDYYGLFMHTTLNSSVVNNTVVTNATRSHALFLYNGASNNTATSNRLTTHGIDSYALMMDNTSSFVDPHNNYIMDSILNATRSSDIHIYGGSFTSYIINSTFNQSNVSFVGATSSTLWIGWWARGFVNATNESAVPNANVTWIDTLGARTSSITQSDGFTARTAVWDYSTNVSEGEVSFNPYIINVTHASYPSRVKSQSITASQDFNFRLNGQGAIGYCGDIESSGQYVVFENISSDGECIHVKANHVDINCNGHTLLYGGTDTGYGINVSLDLGSLTNVSVRNCNIFKNVSGGSFSNFGVYYTNINGGTISNNTVRTHGTSSNYGIYLGSGATGIEVVNNTLWTNGTSSNYAIQISAATNRVINNSITADGTSGPAGIAISGSNNNISANTFRVLGTTGGMGLYLAFGENNTFSNNLFNVSNSGSGNLGAYLSGVSKNKVQGGTIATSGSADNWGIFLQSSALNNTFNGTQIYTQNAGSYGIYFLNQSTSRPANNTFTDLSITAPHASDIFVSTGSENVTNFLVNVTFNQSNVTFFAPGVHPSGNLNVGWWTRAFVNATNQSSIQNASVILNSSLVSRVSTFTDASGFSPFASTTEYIQNNSGKFEANNYTLNITHSSYTGSLTSRNITSSITFNVSLQGDPNAYGTCTPITSSGIYYLQANVTSTGTCITINASDVQFDCRGYTIRYGASGAGIGVNVNHTTLNVARTNVTIKNCVITKDPAGGGSRNFGVRFDNVTNATIFNNSIVTDGVDNNHGIFIWRSTDVNMSTNAVKTNGSSNANIGLYIEFFSFNNIVVDNTVNSSGTSDNYGILLSSTASNTVVRGNTINTLGSAGSNHGLVLSGNAMNNTIDNNIITTSGTTSNIGLYFASNSANNTLSNNTISTYGTSSNIGLRVSSSSSNRITGGRVLTNGTSDSHGIYVDSNSDNNNFTGISVFTQNSSSYGIYVQNNAANLPENNIFTDVLVNSTRANHVQVEIGAVSVNYFVNVTFNQTNVSFVGDPSGDLDVAWWVRGSVSSPSSPISGATVTATRNDSVIEWSAQTDGQGLTSYFATTEYIRNNSGKFPYTNYSFTPSYAGWVASSQSFNFTGTTTVNLTVYPCVGTSPSSGSAWIIQDSTICSNTTLTLNHNITIVQGANLTLYNVTLIFNTSTPNNLSLNNSGSLAILNSNLTAMNTSVFSNESFRFFTLPRGSLLIENSSVFHAGDGSSPYGLGIYISANNTKVLNSSITGSRGTSRIGISIAEAKNTTIDRSRIVTNGSSSDAIYITGSNDVIISSSILLTNGTGRLVYIDSLSNNTLIRSNYLSTVSGSGVEINCIVGGVYQCFNTTVLNNTVVAGANGLYMGYATLDVASYNTITAGTVGIFSYSLAPNYTYNTITTSGDYGAQVYGTSGATIASNAIHSGSATGLYIVSGPYNISSNNITTGGSNTIGIHLITSSGTLIDGNKIESNGTGIEVGSGGSYRFINNTIIARARYGIYHRGTGPNNISLNNIRSVWHGVYLEFSSTGDSVSGNNITVTGDSQRGIIVERQFSNITHNVITVNGTGSNGIYTDYSMQRIIGNTVITNGSQAHGLSLGTENSTIQNNSIYTYGNSSYGLYLRDSRTNSFMNISLLARGPNGTGIYVSGDSDGNNISAALVQTFNLSNFAITFVNTSINRPENNTIQDSFLNATRASQVYYETGSTNVTNYFVNTTFNQTNVTFIGGQSGNLDVAWWVRAFVNASTGPLQNANVTATRNDSIMEWSILTDSQGFTTYLATTEYVQNNSGKFSYTNYTLNASYFGLLKGSRSYNITESVSLNLTLPGPTVIISCQDIVVPGSYAVGLNLSHNATCIGINVSNVSLDCGAHWIFYGAGGKGHGITLNTSVNSQIRNVTISNCTIAKNGTSGTDNYGIHLRNVSSATIRQSTIITNGTSGNFGLYLTGETSNVTIVNNTIRSRGSNFQNSDGIRMQSSAYENSVINNTIFAGLGIGITMQLDTHRNTVIGNIINATGAGQSNAEGIIIWQGSYNTIINNTIGTYNTAANNYGIHVSANGAPANGTNITGNYINPGGTSSGNRGIYLQLGPADTIIDSNTIKTGGTSDNAGLYLEGARSTVVNNVIITSGSGSSNYGLYTQENDDYVNNNTIWTSGTSSNHGIYLSFSNTGNYSNITINATGSGATTYGIYVTGSSQRNRFSGINVSTSGTSSAHGVYLHSSSGLNNFTGMQIQTVNSSSYGVLVQNSSTLRPYNNSFHNTVIISARGDHVSIDTSANETTYFVNVTFNQSNVSFIGNPSGNLDVAWWTRAYVSSLVNGPLSGANVSLFANASILEWRNTTGVDGHTSFFATTEYVQNDSGKVYFTNYSANLSVESYRATQFVNVTESLTINFSITGLIGCQTIGAPGAYTLASNVNAVNGCFIINSSHVDFSCEGRIITYGSSGTGVGIYISNDGGTDITNVTVRNCIIQKSGSSGSDNIGIHLLNVNSSRILNSSIATGGTTNNWGVYSEQSNYNTIDVVTVNASGSTNFNYGIYVYQSSNNNITDLNVSTRGTDHNYGVFVDSASANNTFTRLKVNATGTADNNYGFYADSSPAVKVNSVTLETNGTTDNYGVYLFASNFTQFNRTGIVAKGSSASHGLYLDSTSMSGFLHINSSTIGQSGHAATVVGNSDQNNFSTINFTTSGLGAYGIHFAGGSGTPNANRFLDGRLSTALADHIRSDVGGSVTNYLVNVTFNQTNVSFGASPSGNINVSWRVRAFVNGSTSATIPEANVTARINGSRTQWNNLTDANGFTPFHEATQYVQNDTALYDFSNYTFAIVANVHAFNFTQTMNSSGTLNFTLNQSQIGNCGNITESGQYRLIQNISSPSTCLRINASHVELNCAGYSVTFASSSTAGIHLMGAGELRNITVRNCVILSSSNTASKTGIEVANVTDALIVNNSVSISGTNTQRGINIGTESENATVRGNSILLFPANNANRGIGVVTNSTGTVVDANYVSVVGGGGASGSSILVVNLGSHYTNLTNNIGHLLLVDSSTGVYAGNSANLTVFNNTINVTQSGGTILYGIDLDTTATSYVINNRINLSGSGSSQSYGVITTNSNDCQLIGNGFVTTSTSSSGNNYGIYLNGGDRCTVVNSSAALYVTSGNALAFWGSVGNQIVNSNFSILGTAASSRGFLFSSSSNSNNFDRIRINVNGTRTVMGVDMTDISSSNNNTFNNTYVGVQGNQSIGISINLGNNTFTNTIINITVNGSHELLTTEGAPSALVNNLTLLRGNVTISGIFHNNTGIKSVVGPTDNVPADPAGFFNLSKYVNITNVSTAKNFVLLNISYSDSEINSRGMEEYTLQIMRYNQTAARWEPASVHSTYYGIDSIGNLVYANISQQPSTGTFGVFGEKLRPTVSFTPPTPANNTNWTNVTVMINASVVNASDLGVLQFMWNRTNYTYYNRSLNLMMNFQNLSSLGENGARVRDVSLYENNATCTTCPTWTTSGKYGGAYLYDGLNDHFTVADANTLDLPANFTISVWVKKDNLNDDSGYVVEKGDTTINHFNYMITLGRDTGGAGFGVSGRFNFGLRESGGLAMNVYSSQSYTTGWHHIVAVYNGFNQSTLYIDGVNDTNVGFETGFTGPTTTATSLQIGRGDGLSGSFDYFAGTIDELKIWNRTLSTQEVERLYRTDLQRVDMDKWNLHFNVTNLTRPENLTYSVTVFDTSNLDNTTGVRTLVVPSIAPNVTNIRLNATLFTNKTDSNLTVTYQSIDFNGDPVTNITNWFVNNLSLTLLNMPFDTNVSSLAARAVRDYTPYMNNGTLGSGDSSRAPNWKSTCISGGCYEFDGSDDLINISDAESLDIVSNFTIVLRMYQRQNQTNGYRLMDKITAGTSDGWFLDTYGSGGLTGRQLRFCANTSCAFGQTVYNLSTWYHVAVVVNSTNASLYLDGTLDGTGSIANITANNLPLFLGAPHEGCGGGCGLVEFFNGSLESVQIYNRTLSSEQIRQLYLNRSDVIVANETEINDIWYVNITPNDGTTDGATARSNDVIIKPNSPPGVLTISPITVTPVENTVTQATFWVWVQENDSLSEISNVNLTVYAESTTHQNASCSFVNNINDTVANYSCSVPIAWFDPAGTWTANVTAIDLENAVSTTKSSPFTIEYLTAIVIGPSNISWSQLLPSQVNRTALTAITINNTGNRNISQGNISINASHLYGVTNASFYIPASNFSISADSSTSCVAGTLANQTLHGTEIFIASANLTRGNYTQGTGTGQEQLYLCLREVPSSMNGLAFLPQRYASNVSWVISVIPI